MTRRDFMRILLASAVAEAVDVERLLWTPKPIITVPAIPQTMNFLMADGVWEKFALEWARAGAITGGTASFFVFDRR